MSNNLNIENVAQLARLFLSDEEKQSLSKDLSVILDYVDELNAVDTENVAPTSHVLNLENVYREDEMEKTSVIEDVLSHLPEVRKEGNFFKVPKVIDN